MCTPNCKLSFYEDFEGGPKIKTTSYFQRIIDYNLIKNKIGSSPFKLIAKNINYLLYTRTYFAINVMQFQ